MATIRQARRVTMGGMGKVTVLDALGLDEAHTAVYRCVLQQPSASTADIAAALGMSLPRVRPMVAEL